MTKERNERQDITKGVLTPGTKITPSKSAWPLTGQRSIRGLGILVIIALFFFNIGQSVIVLYLHSNRTVRVVPEAESVSVGGRLEKVNTTILKAFATRFVVDYGTYSPITVDTLMDRVGPRLHPKTQDQIAAEIKKRADEVKMQKLFVVTIPRQSLMYSNKDGLTTMVVRADEITRAAIDVNESISEIPTKDQSRLMELAGRRDLCWIVQFSQVDQTEDNPEGFRVLRCWPQTEQEWMKQTKYAFWKQ